MVLFGGEQSGAHVGAAGFCQKITLERSIHADAAVRRRVCGNRACATARPSGEIRAAVAVCGGARGSKLAAPAAAKTHRGLPDMGRRAAKKKEFFHGHVCMVLGFNEHEKSDC